MSGVRQITIHRRISRKLLWSLVLISLCFVSHLFLSFWYNTELRQHVSYQLPLLQQQQKILQQATKFKSILNEPIVDNEVINGNRQRQLELAWLNLSSDADLMLLLVSERGNNSLPENLLDHQRQIQHLGALTDELIRHQELLKQSINEALLALQFLDNALASELNNAESNTLSTLGRNNLTSEKKRETIENQLQLNTNLRQFKQALNPIIQWLVKSSQQELGAENAKVQMDELTQIFSRFEHEVHFATSTQLKSAFLLARDATSAQSALANAVREQTQHHQALNQSKFVLEQVLSAFISQISALGLTEPKLLTEYLPENMQSQLSEENLWRLLIGLIAFVFLLVSFLLIRSQIQLKRVGHALSIEPAETNLPQEQSQPDSDHNFQLPGHIFWHYDLDNHALSIDHMHSDADVLRELQLEQSLDHNLLWTRVLARDKVKIRRQLRLLTIGKPRSVSCSIHCKTDPKLNESVSCEMTMRLSAKGLIGVLKPNAELQVLHNQLTQAEKQLAQLEFIQQQQTGKAVQQCLIQQKQINQSYQQQLLLPERQTQFMQQLDFACLKFTLSEHIYAGINGAHKPSRTMDNVGRVIESICLNQLFVLGKGPKLEVNVTEERWQQVEIDVYPFALLLETICAQWQLMTSADVLKLEISLNDIDSKRAAMTLKFSCQSCSQPLFYRSGQVNDSDSELLQSAFDVLLTDLFAEILTQSVPLEPCQLEIQLPVTIAKSNNGMYWPEKVRHLVYVGDNKPDKHWLGRLKAFNLDVAYHASDKVTSLMAQNQLLKSNGTLVVMDASCSPSVTDKVFSYLEKQSSDAQFWFYVAQPLPQFIAAPTPKVFCLADNRDSKTVSIAQLTNFLQLNRKHNLVAALPPDFMQQIKGKIPLKVLIIASVPARYDWLAKILCIAGMTPQFATGFYSNNLSAQGFGMVLHEPNESEKDLEWIEVESGDIVDSARHFTIGLTPEVNVQIYPELGLTAILQQLAPWLSLSDAQKQPEPSNSKRVINKAPAEKIAQFVDTLDLAQFDFHIGNPEVGLMMLDTYAELAQNYVQRLLSAYENSRDGEFEQALKMLTNLAKYLGAQNLLLCLAQLNKCENKDVKSKEALLMKTQLIVSGIKTYCQMGL